MLDVRVRTEKNTKAQGEEESKRETKRERERYSAIIVTRESSFT